MAGVPSPSPPRHEDDSGLRGDAPQNEVPAAVRLTLVLPEGPQRSLAVGDRLVFGRDPVTSDGIPVPVDDPTLTMSKTHAALARHADRVTIEDLGSTNGTEVVANDGRRQPVPPSIPTTVSPQAKLCFGDVTISLQEA